MSEAYWRTLSTVMKRAFWRRKGAGGRFEGDFCSRESVTYTEGAYIRVKGLGSKSKANISEPTRTVGPLFPAAVGIGAMAEWIKVSPQIFLETSLC